MNGYVNLTISRSRVPQNVFIPPSVFASPTVCATFLIVILFLSDFCDDWYFTCVRRMRYASLASLMIVSAHDQSPLSCYIITNFTLFVPFLDDSRYPSSILRPNKHEVIPTGYFSPDLLISVSHSILL